MIHLTYDDGTVVLRGTSRALCCSNMLHSSFEHALKVGVLMRNQARASLFHEITKSKDSGNMELTESLTKRAVDAGFDLMEIIDKRVPHRVLHKMRCRAPHWPATLRSYPEISYQSRRCTVFTFYTFPCQSLGLYTDDHLATTSRLHL